MFALSNRKIAKSVEKLFRYSFCWNIRLFVFLLLITIKHIKIKENNYYCSKPIFFMATENVLLRLYGVLIHIILRNIKIKKKQKKKEKKKETTLLTFCAAYSGVIAEELLENSVPTRPYIYYYIISYHTF